MEGPIDESENVERKFFAEMERHYQGNTEAEKAWKESRELVPIASPSTSSVDIDDTKDVAKTLDNVLQTLNRVTAFTAIPDQKGEELYKALHQKFSEARFAFSSLLHKQCTQFRRVYFGSHFFFPLSAPNFNASFPDCSSWAKTLINVMYEVGNNPEKAKRSLHSVCNTGAILLAALAKSLSVRTCPIASPLQT
jgi:hypothetical protein